MTKKEAIERLELVLANCSSNIWDEGYTCEECEMNCDEAIDMAIETLKIQDESKTKNIIYDFLTAKLGEDIMNNPFKFEDWFNRMVWHVQECYKLNKKLLMNTGDCDLISRQTAIQAGHDYFKDKLDEIPTEETEDGYEVYSDISKVNEFLSDNKHLSKRIKNLPSAEPTPNKEKGEWYIREYEFFTCDQCGEDVLSHAECTSEAKRKLADGDFPNFCENCGADMRGDKE